MWNTGYLLIVRVQSHIEMVLNSFFLLKYSQPYLIVPLVTLFLWGSAGFASLRVWGQLAGRQRALGSWWAASWTWVNSVHSERRSPYWAALGQAQPAGHRKCLFPSRACVCAHIWSAMAVLGSPLQERYQQTGAKPEKGYWHRQGLEHTTAEGMYLFSQAKRRPKGDLFSVFKYVTGGYREIEALSSQRFTMKWQKTMIKRCSTRPCKWT